ncbi:hypothetical protein BSN85_18070 [Bradyrhizobium brasilense]|nr:hypothetical protein BSN85_18070 [Bradyrhizobium brasilense]
MLVLLDLLALGPKQLSETASLTRIDQKVAGRFVLGAAFGFDDRKLQHAEDAILAARASTSAFRIWHLTSILGRLLQFAARHHHDGLRRRSWFCCFSP